MSRAAMQVAQALTATTTLKLMKSTQNWSAADH